MTQFSDYRLRRCRQKDTNASFCVASSRMLQKSQVVLEASAFDSSTVLTSRIRLVCSKYDIQILLLQESLYPSIKSEEQLAKSEVSRQR